MSPVMTRFCANGKSSRQDAAASVQCEAPLGRWESLSLYCHLTSRLSSPTIEPGAAQRVQQRAAAGRERGHQRHDAPLADGEQRHGRRRRAAAHVGRCAAGGAAAQAPEDGQPPGKCCR